MLKRFINLSLGFLAEVLLDDTIVALGEVCEVLLGVHHFNWSVRRWHQHLWLLMLIDVSWSLCFDCLQLLQGFLSHSLEIGYLCVVLADVEFGLHVLELLALSWIMVLLVMPLNFVKVLVECDGFLVKVSQHIFDFDI